jgi:hypothetical protein
MIAASTCLLRNAATSSVTKHSIRRQRSNTVPFAARGTSRTCSEVGDGPDSTGFSRRQAFVSACALALTAASPAQAKDGKNGVYFIEPRGDNPVVSSEFKVKMGVKGYELAPAAAGLQEGTGHHHLIIDGPAFIEKGQEIPFDETHLHFGKAQKEGVLNLSPGEHTLTLQFADAKHRSFGKKFAKSIKVTVE